MGDEAKEVVVLVPSLCMESAIETAKSSNVSVGGQNCYWQTSGAFTGETSPEVLKQMGAKFCLVGHTERRQLFSENDEKVARKVKALQSQGIVPIVCIGEQLDERENKQTFAILRRQLDVGLSEAVAGKPFWIAYEPVWAIGTGKVATPDQVMEAHGLIREWIKGKFPDQSKAPILYGGSVKGSNASELKLPNVDGFLIGGASLDVASFLGILRA